MTEEQPAFIVRNGGKEYRIFANGHVEGFDEPGPCLVINRIPVLVGQARAEAARNGA